MSFSRSTCLLLTLSTLAWSAFPLRADIRTWRDNTGKIHMSNIEMPDLPAFRKSSYVAAHPPAQRSYSVPRTAGISSINGRYDSLIREAAERYGVDFRLIKAVIHARARSTTGRSVPRAPWG